MLDFHVVRDETTHKPYLKTSLSGKPLLTTPQLNKGTAFTMEERHNFSLLGKLPHRIETLEEQVKRAYLQYSGYTTRLQQNIYLNNLNDKNQVLFYKLISEHLEEMLPTIYTPIVGTAVKRYSHEYRQPRGLYITHNDIPYLDEILENRTNPNIELIVVTDGEGVLGIGDQGIGGMDIPVAKLMVYTLCGGIDPTRTLPIFLDVGTNNQELLDDPMYLGCCHKRIPQKDYDVFIEAFVKTVQKHFPNAFLHWEDFGRHNSRNILDTYQEKICTFNDDIQGTGAVTLAALLSAAKVTKMPLSQHRMIVFGAGSAGTGVSDQILDALMREGLSKEEAYARFWLIDRQGLLLDNDPHLTDSQRPYARPASESDSWNVSGIPNLEATINAIKPTILIGASAQTGAFHQALIENMAKYCERPIIFPLSNPDDKCEATPEQLLKWTNGRALIATGTAFPPVSFNGHDIPIAQCNNALVFPGIGLGVLIAKANRLTNNMIWAAAEALSLCGPALYDDTQPLLPPISDAQIIAKKIAIAVAEQSIKDGVAESQSQDALIKTLEERFWKPEYLPFLRSE